MAETEQVVEKKKVGRPSSYTQEIGNQICAQLADGKSLRTICKADDMPERKTVFNWFTTQEEFLHQYTRAKEASADALADDIEDIANKTLNGVYDSNSARVALDAKKWVASKLKPKKYGDRIQHANDPENPMPTAATIPPELLAKFNDFMTHGTKE